ncbi:MAG: hypothetical protein V2I36_04640 [Desulfopila sp.]|nr:hypothetical protein [Desulfopila sp.]
MKVEEVPQDKGMIGDYGREVCYAVGRNGRYRLSPSLGWEAKNIVNDQAWEVIVAEAARMHAKVKAGTVSPIAYHQAKHQMDLSLLSQYVNMARWRVRRHLKPAVFNKLPVRILQRYADVFSLTVEELQTVPPTFSPEDIRR